jgi:hypothetical protein
VLDHGANRKYSGPEVGFRKFERQGLRNFRDIVPDDFTPALAKHTKSFNLVDTLSVGVDRILRNFEPMQRQVESWRLRCSGEADLLLGICREKLDAPKSLLPDVHRLYFEPQYPEFSPRMMREAAVPLIVRSTNTFYVPEQGLCVALAGSQHMAETALRRSLENWLATGGIAMRFLISPGGLGKSFIVQPSQRGRLQGLEPIGSIGRENPGPYDKRCSRLAWFA